ncbi:MAG TPA: ATP-binding protein [Longimicrobiales bacterium]|nr:ATP-binding protein [Longimicrobiales bacterium]
MPREREDRFRFLFEDNPTVYLEVDAAGTITSITRYGAEHLGYTVPELTGRPVTDMVHPADREAVRRQFEECGRTPGRLCRWEFRKVRKDGSVLWVRDNVRPVRQTDGQLVFLVVCDDMTDVRRAEAERERLLERQQFLAEASRALAGSIDYETTLCTVARLAVPVLADFVIVDVVEEAGGFRRIAAAIADPEKEALAREARRYPPDPAVKDNLVNRAIRTRRSEIVSGEEAIRTSGYRAEHLDAMRQLEPHSVLVAPMIARERAVGAIQFISLAGESARDYGPEDIPLAEELAGRAAIAIDNARLYREAEQRAREERALREAVGALGAALTTEELIRRIATSAMEASGARGAFVSWIHPERDEVETIAMAGDIPPPVEGRIPYANSYTRKVIERREPLGIPRLADLEGPLRDSALARACPDCSAVVTPLIVDKRPIGALFLVVGAEPEAVSPEGLARARTYSELASVAFRRLQLLQEAERRRDELERLSESRAHLMRGFSHDVKNPLGAAAGYAELLEAGTLGELSAKQREGVQRIHRSIQTGLRLIEDLLGVAREETGEIQVERTRTDVARVAREVADEFRAQATAAGLTLECQAPGPVFAETDPVRVRQIVGNLLSNAVKYTPEGTITLAAALRDGGEGFRPGEWVAVSVTDTGLGIPEDKHERVFQEGTRLHPEIRAGVGVGLANSRRTARALGGDITLRSEVGRGSTFTLWLPPAA